MTLREHIQSVDSEQYSDSQLYQEQRETKPESGFYIADVDDHDYLSELVIETCKSLPEPKFRRKKYFHEQSIG